MTDLYHTGGQGTGGAGKGAAAEEGETEGEDRGMGKQDPPPEEGRISKRQHRAEKRRRYKRRRHMRKGTGTERLQWGAPVEVIRVGGGLSPPEENSDLLDFTPERVHLLFWGVYGDFPHHNNGSHLDGEVADDAIYQRCWRRLAAQ